MSMSIDAYIDAFASLNTSGTHDWPDATLNKAPYKPLLLLSVLDLVAEEIIDKKLVSLDANLFDTFNAYWDRIVDVDWSPNIAMPFYYMKSEGFWHLIRNDGKRDNSISLSNVSPSGLDSKIKGASLDSNLLRYMQDSESREQLRRVLVETFFAQDAKPDVYDQGRVNKEAYHYSQKLFEQASGNASPHSREVEQPVRAQGFRHVIVTAYQHRCAFCGVRVRTPHHHSVIEAAHIIPWSISQNDDPRNGLALCRLCHWVFDEGLIAVSERSKILFSRALRSSYNILGHLGSLEGRPIFPPQGEFLKPDPDALAWHKEEMFIT